MSAVVEDDFPKGHPKRFDYDPASPEAQEWARRNVHPKGERDFPVDHPKAADTPGNTNSVEWRAGVDPARPDLEPFTGRTQAQAAAAREVYQQRAETVSESPAKTPVNADEVNAAIEARRQELNLWVLPDDEIAAIHERFAAQAAEGEAPAWDAQSSA